MKLGPVKWYKKNSKHYCTSLQLVIDSSFTGFGG